MFIDRRPGDVPVCLELVREGIALRRCWGECSGDDSAANRRGQLRTLVALQGVCQPMVVHWLQAAVEDNRGGGGGPIETAESNAATSSVAAQRRSQFVASLLTQIGEGDEYLAGLLNDTSRSSARLTAAVEAFRDDLHWLATLVAAADGTAAPDLVTRVLAEQESIVRMLESVEEGAMRRSTGDLNPGDHVWGTNERTPAHLEVRHISEQLLRSALTRRTRVLIGREEPSDPQGWYQRWQSASRLVVHWKGIEPAQRRASGEAELAVRGAISAAGSLDALFAALRGFHAQATEKWKEHLDGLSEPQRVASLQAAARDLMDTASDTLTFLEDQPLEEDVRQLEVLEEDIATCRSAITTPHTADAKQRGSCKQLRRKLRRCHASVKAELQERRLAWRMERLFGRRAVAALERFILGALFLFLVLLMIEAPLVRWEAGLVSMPEQGEAIMSAPGPVEAAFAWIDGAICLVFLAEFGLKLFLAQGRLRYLRRHFLIGLVPAIPFGFLAYVAHHVALANYAERLVLLRFLRYARLPRMARWLRAARPLVRLGRLFAFTLRAGDRLVRRMAPLLNRNLILFERAGVESREPQYRIALAALRERFIYRATRVGARMTPAQRCRVAKQRMEDLGEILAAAPVGVVSRGATVDVASSREIPVESVIARMMTANPALVTERLGPRMTEQLARWCRVFDFPLIRRLPFVAQFAAASRLQDPGETVARVANQLGLLMKRALDRVYWCADLYGTLTAPQLVDAMGDWLVKGTGRPTRRLLLLGGSFLLVSYLASLVPLQLLQTVSDRLGKFVASSLIIVGLLCLVPLSLGIWFRRIAGQATEFYDQVAEAQYLTATKQLKQRYARRHRSTLYDAVVSPELCLISDGRRGDERRRQVERTVDGLLEDYLDGAPFHRTDTKTTTQLLGNLVLVSLRTSRLRYRRRDLARLRRLDLERDRGSFAGPYLWFHFISRSLAQHTAKLVVDYNAHALPLARAATASAAEVAGYAHWLSERLGVPAATGVLPEVFQRGAVSDTAVATAERIGTTLQQSAVGMYFHGNDFTARHFLVGDRQLLEEVRARYGEQLADLVRRDRRDNVRRVFRSFPFHHWPKEKRTFNPLMTYQRHFAGGRVLLLPLKGIACLAVLAARAAILVASVVRDLINPAEVALSGLRESDPFAVAVRKIHRMRQPVFLECLKMRALFDPEYVGVALPVESSGEQTSQAPIERDLQRIGAGLRLREMYRRLSVQRRRQMREFTDWLRRFGWSGATANFDRESLRAMAVAYCTDYDHLRSRLEATARLKRVLDEAIAGGAQRSSRPRRGWPRRMLVGLLHQSRGRFNNRHLRRLFDQPAFRTYSPEQRRLCRRALQGDRSLLCALRQLTAGNVPADPVDAARRVLLSVARDPSTWSQQMLVLRTVQTLTVLDLQTYCELVRDLGEYDDPVAAGESKDPG